MIVLSLFDGISCGRVAFERAGINVKKYYASEIDKYAQIVSAKNYPDIIRIGDITKWQEWEIEKPDIIIGGSPCQGFSFAGKQLNFNDERSKLFFTFVEILNHYKPKYFLLENVKMKKEYQDAISKYLGVEPIEINSALVSAQNRKRLYWTNIPNVTQPEDKGISIKDIVDERDDLFREDSRIKNKSVKTKNYIKYDISGKGYFSQQDRLYFKNSKFPSIPKCRTESKLNLYISDNVYKKTSPIECERLQTLPDNYTEGISKTRRFETLGNGWTVDVIAHIFRGIK